MPKKSRSTTRGTKAGAIKSYHAEVASPTASAETGNILFGKESQTTNTEDSSARSETHRKAVKTHTRQRQSRVSKVDPQTLLEIAQTALARLGESGVQVLARTNSRDIVITICGADIDGVTKTFKLSPPDPLYNLPKGD